MKSLIHSSRSLIDSFRKRRWCHLAVANLRILLGFAFLPAGLKKVLYQPFTEPQNTGTFHEFLHSFYATGVFYQFVGGVQLLAAALLMTQTFATLGALMTLPVIVTILVFCWSTGVVATAIVVTLMTCGTVGLIAWDHDRWWRVLAPDYRPSSKDCSEGLIDISLWRACGGGIFLFYGFTCLLYGGVYRPKGVDLGNPAFYALPLILMFPIVTWLVEERRRRRNPEV